MSDSDRKRISIAIAAMGGQGGGVLGDWIVAIAEAITFHIAEVEDVEHALHRVLHELLEVRLGERDPVAEVVLLELLLLAADEPADVALDVADAVRGVFDAPLEGPVERVAAAAEVPFGRFGSSRRSVRRSS